MRLSFALSLVLSAISINAKHTNKLHQDLFIENVKPSGLVPATSAQSPVSNANAGHPSQPFQVDVPIVTPPTASCTVLLAQHSFANSYGAPFIGAYTPPKGKCGSENWSKVVLNWTVSSIGGQYDRIAFIGLGATEIFRTSTAEPNNKGIHWTQLKDVTRFSSLWAKPSTIVIDLGNIISGRLNASYDVTMSATFYASTKKYPVPDGTPDLVIPVTTQNASQSPALSVPNAASALVTIPQNTVRAFIELRASGNGAEEFWYTVSRALYTLQWLILRMLLLITRPTLVLHRLVHSKSSPQQSMVNLYQPLFHSQSSLQVASHQAYGSLSSPSMLSIFFQRQLTSPPSFHCWSTAKHIIFP